MDGGKLCLLLRASAEQKHDCKHMLLALFSVKQERAAVLFPLGIASLNGYATSSVRGWFVVHAEGKQGGLARTKNFEFYAQSVTTPDDDVTKRHDRLETM